MWFPAANLRHEHSICRQVRDCHVLRPVRHGPQCEVFHACASSSSPARRLRRCPPRRRRPGRRRTGQGRADLSRGQRPAHRPQRAVRRAMEEGLRPRARRDQRQRRHQGPAARLRLRGHAERSAPVGGGGAEVRRRPDDRGRARRLLQPGLDGRLADLPDAPSWCSSASPTRIPTSPRAATTCGATRSARPTSSRSAPPMRSSGSG